MKFLINFKASNNCLLMISPQCIHLVANKLTGLIERTFPREHALNLACNEERAFSLLMIITIINQCLAKICESLVYLLDNGFIRVGTKLYRQIVDIPMGTTCNYVSPLQI